MAVVPGAVAARLAADAARLKMTVEAFVKKFGRVSHHPIASEAIKEIWYQGLTETLWINFNKVRAYPKYKFEGVPGSVVTSLLNSTSAGSVYHSQIKGNYYTSSISGPEEDGTVSHHQQIN